MKGKKKVRVSHQLWFLFIVFFISIISQQSICAKTESTFKMSYVEDFESKFTIENIYQKEFNEVAVPYLNLGIVHHPVWIKINLPKVTSQQDVVIEIENALLDTITLSYTLRNNQIAQDTLGLAFPQSYNKLEHYLPAFILPTSELAKPDVYIKIKSRWPVVVDISVLPKDEFNNRRTKTYLLEGLLIGCFLFMGIYNLFLFLSIRDISYLIYVLTLFSNLLSQSYNSGVLMRYISPETPYLSLSIPVFTLGMTGILSCWFAIRFLEIKKISKPFYFLLLSGILISFSSIILELFKLQNLASEISVVNLIYASLAVLSSSIYCTAKGNKTAMYFMLAWSFYLLGVLVFVLQTLGIAPHTPFTKYFIHVGSIMEVMLLSFALGHKFYLMRLEKERLERQTREELEALVKVQTKEIKASLKEKDVLLKEIHHRVKNNLQLVISLLDLQSASTKDESNKKILAQSKSRMHSMSLIHQKLYQSQNMASIDVKSYLEELLTYIESSYLQTNQQGQTEVNIESKELSLDTLIPLGLIVNELLTNSFKYGKTGNAPLKIKLHLWLENKSMILLVGDSGPGFDDKKHNQGVKSSLGLFLIKSLSRQLRSEISRYRKGGFFYTRIDIPLKEPIYS